MDKLFDGKPQMINPPKQLWKVKYSSVINPDLIDLYRNYELEQIHLQVEREKEEQNLIRELNETNA